MKRRSFIQKAGIGSLAGAILPAGAGASLSAKKEQGRISFIIGKQALSGC